MTDGKPITGTGIKQSTIWKSHFSRKSLAITKLFNFHAFWNSILSAKWVYYSFTQWPKRHWSKPLFCLRDGIVFHSHFFYIQQNLLSSVPLKCLFYRFRWFSCGFSSFAFLLSPAANLQSSLLYSSSDAAPPAKAESGGNEVFSLQIHLSALQCFQLNAFTFSLHFIFITINLFLSSLKPFLMVLFFLHNNVCIPLTFYTWSLVIDNTLLFSSVHTSQILLRQVKYVLERESSREIQGLLYASWLVLQLWHIRVE